MKCRAIMVVRLFCFLGMMILLMTGFYCSTSSTGLLLTLNLPHALTNYPSHLDNLSAGTKDTLMIKELLEKDVVPKSAIVKVATTGDKVHSIESPRVATNKQQLPQTRELQSQSQQQLSQRLPPNLRNRYKGRPLPSRLLKEPPPKVPMVRGNGPISWVEKEPPTLPINAMGPQTMDEAPIPEYIQKHCNLTGLSHWMPPEESWQRRVPAFFILGTKKGGTTGLFTTLTSHPNIISGRTKELLYFIPMRFPHFQNEEIGAPVNVAEARRQLYETQFPIARLQRDNRLVTGEATPDYLLFSEYSARAILCTAPWAKLIVLLRNPLERLFSHYNFIRDPNRKNISLPSFENWVRRDIQVLQSAGVLPKNLTELDSYMGSEEELQGWHRYQRTVHTGIADKPFARSLYALQLEEWHRNLRAAGRDPASAMKIVLSKDISQPNSAAVRDLVSWVRPEEGHGAEPRQDESTSEVQSKKAMVTHYTTSKIDPKFQAWLQKTIFEPYNQRLYRLLGPSYDGIFDGDEI